MSDKYFNCIEHIRMDQPYHYDLIAEKKLKYDEIHDLLKTIYPKDVPQDFIYLNMVMSKNMATYKMRRNKYEFLINADVNVVGGAIKPPFNTFTVLVPENTVAEEPVSILVIFASGINNNKKYMTVTTIGKSGMIGNQVELSDNMVNDVSDYEYGGNTDGERAKRSLKLAYNLSVYLTTKDPDIQKVLGIKYIAKGKKRKKIMKAIHQNGYDHYDVGKIFDERIKYMKSNNIKTGRKNAPCLVSGFFREQWYGPKTEEHPLGTHQEVIFVESFEKGIGAKGKTVEIMGEKA